MRAVRVRRKRIEGRSATTVEEALDSFYSGTTASAVELGVRPGRGARRGGELPGSLESCPSSGMQSPLV